MPLSNDPFAWSEHVLEAGAALQGAARGQTARPDADSASEAGELVLSALQQCIFGAHLRHVPFLKLVCSQSFEQVCVFPPLQ